MAIAALLCVPLTPLILSLSLPGGEQGLELDSLGITQIVLTAQLVPIARLQVEHKVKLMAAQVEIQPDTPCLENGSHQDLRNNPGEGLASRRRP